ncbi:MAG: phosphoribosylglycinamide formyltransferase [Anaerolineae bacterium]|nr:phosphoribosylglycinamide formyltransferase [Anaerolineae bacterium]
MLETGINPMRLVVLISGSGSNLQAIIDAIDSGHLDAKIALVVSNRQSAYGLQRADAAGIPTLYFPLKPYRDAGQPRNLYDTDLADQIALHTPDLIVLAGWMHILSPAFLNRFPRQVINLHPALPGTFPGTDGIRRTYEAYQRGEVEHGGCMIHYVIPEVDAGDVIVKEIVPIEPGDTLEQFEEHIHAAEHRIIVEAIRLIAGAGSAK